MPTNEERREVAAEMRARGYELYSVNIFNVGEQVGLDMDEFDDSDDTREAVWNRLADLIEPEPERTCRNDSLKKGKGVFLCSTCSVHLDIAEMDEEDLDIFYEPNYCPNCDAKVVE